MKLLFLSILVPLVFFAQTSEQRLDSIFSEGMKKWNVPGMSVGIVKNDSVVFLKGYGITDVKNPQKVDENTLFSIASNTKLFTATGIAMLVSEGKLNWEDRVQEHLPFFKLYDPYVTEFITIEDILSHRSGLGTFSGDLIWYGSDYSREEIIRRARYLEPKHDFRTEFGYSNILYIAAGELLGQTAQMSWDNFMKDRIFTPLGMDRTITRFSEMKKDDNVAMPHNEKNGELINVGYLSWDNIGGAGAIFSTVKDMSTWLKFQLNDTKIGDSSLVNPQDLEETRTPHTNIRIGKGSRSIWPSKHFQSYGLGIEMMDYKGYEVFMHGGGADGMVSRLVMVPELDLGFIILTNSTNSLPYAFMFSVLDEYIDINKKQDWADMFYEFKISREEREKRMRYAEEQKRVPNTKTTLPLEKYAGIYRSDIYGDVEVKINNEKLIVQFTHTPIFKGYLKHWHYNTFEIEMKKVPSLPKGKCSFIIDELGEVEEMRIDIPNPDFNFKELKLYRVKEKD